MPYDVFISHSSQDKVIADAVTHALEAEGIRCWIAPRDIRPGETWGAAILEAIGNTRIMVVIFSTHSNESTQVMREVERAVQRDRIVIPFRIEACAPSGDMEYFLSATHWLDALEPDREQQIGELVTTVRSFTGARRGDAEPEAEAAAAEAPARAEVAEPPPLPLPTQSATSPQPVSAAPGPPPGAGVAVGPSPGALARVGALPRPALLAAAAAAAVGLALVLALAFGGEDDPLAGLAVVPGEEDLQIAEGFGIEFGAEITDPMLHPEPEGLHWLLDGVEQTRGLSYRFEPGFDLGGSVHTVALQAEASNGEILRREWQIDVIDKPQLQISALPSEPSLKLRPGESAEFGVDATDEQGAPIEVAVRWLLDGEEQSTAKAWSFDATDEQTGSHTVTVVASDAEGNVLEQREWQVGVSETPADVAAGPRAGGANVIERGAGKLKDTVFGLGDRLRGRGD